MVRATFISSMVFQNFDICWIGDVGVQADAHQSHHSRGSAAVSCQSTGKFQEHLYVLSSMNSHTSTKARIWS